MKVISQIGELRNMLKGHRKKNEIIGFVPTMGYLHEGHLSLVRTSMDDNDITVVSIFINPTQFGPNEDLDSYPRDLEKDKKLLEDLEVDYVFFPQLEDIYPDGYSTYVNVESELTKRLCGASREGHFKGVTTIVSKLFNIVQPDRAYFGQKDAQQVAVIRRMVKDLNFGIEIKAIPIVRELDGLALSSRNSYLNEIQRKDALVLSQALSKAKDMFCLDKINKADIIREAMKTVIDSAPTSRIEYIEIVDFDDLQPIEVIDKKVLIAIAVYIGSTRLIDNIVLEV